MHHGIRSFSRTGSLLAACSLWTAAGTLASAAEPTPDRPTIFHPFDDRPEASRHVNDMLVYDGRLFVGTGDATVNTGPTPLRVMKLDDDTWTEPLVVDDESISAIRVLDGTVVIPGHDATEAWTHGNMYVREPDGWVKHRSVPGAIHVIDVMAFDGAWYAVTGSRLPAVEGDTGARAGTVAVGTVVRSDDRGKTWNVVCRTPGVTGRTMRLVSLGAVDGKLLAFPYAHGIIAEYDLSEDMRGLLVNPYTFGSQTGYAVRIADVLGDVDDAMTTSDGERWSAVDLLNAEGDTAGITMIRPAQFGEDLVLVVDAGGPMPSGRHVPEDADRSMFTPTTTLWVFEGNVPRRLNWPGEGTPTIADIYTAGDTLWLLGRNATGWHAWHTTDLASWKSIDLTTEHGTPRAIAANDDTVFIGTDRGTIVELAQ